MTEETLQPRTRIQLCGRLVVELDGRRVEADLPSRQGRMLFAYLAHNLHRPVRREELIECLWPSERPADSAAALNTLISRLRRAIGAGVIEGTSELSLALAPDAEIDVELAAGALAKAQAAIADRDWQAAWGPAHAALAIARRGLLPGLEAPWIDRARSDLEDLELDALEAVAETGLGLGGAELAAAERASSTLVARAPFRESGHRLRMEALAAGGNVAEALQAYEELRRLLAEELGTGPSPALAALHGWLLRGEGAETRAGPRRPAADAAPFVGRGRELAALERVLADRRGVVLIGGEPGIGKTRLAQELAARAGGEAFWGRCHDGQGAPAFWPWVEVLRAIAQRTRPEPLRRALGTDGGRLSKLAPELAELFPDLPASVPLDPQAARFALLDGLSRFLVRLSAAGPIVLVLEDLHWADPPSLEVLRFLAARPEEVPVLLVGTYRDTEVAEPLAASLADLAPRPAVTRVALAGLAEDELAAFVAHATGAEAAPPLVAALHHRTEGNPFFVSELVWALASGADTAEAVPGGVRDVIRHRLGRLPEDVAQALSRAAVIGDEFDLDLLAAVFELDAERTLELVEVALKERIAAETPGTPGRFHFVHALIRETLYTELSAVRRARLHQRIGDALERLDPGLVTELAHHYYEGAAPKAFAYALLAAERATTTQAYEQAELQLRRALELAEHPRQELAAQVQLGGLLMMTRGYASAAVGEAGARASELARELGDDSQLLPALWRLGVFHEVRGEVDRSRAIGEQLRELGSENGRADFRLGGSQLVGVSALMCGEHALARERLTDAIALADPLGDAARVFGHDFRVTARAFLGGTLALQGDETEAGELLADALALASDPFDEALARFFNAFSAVFRRDVVAARMHAEAEIALCEERGFPVFAAMAGIVRGWAVGEWAAIEMGLAALEATGARMMLDCFYALLAETRRRAGDLPAARAAVELGLAEIGPEGRFYEAELRRLDGELLVAEGRAGDAAAALHTAVAVAASQGSPLLELRARASSWRHP